MIPARMAFDRLPPVRKRTTGFIRSVLLALVLGGAIGALIGHGVSS